jgi:hypothetical protein
MERARLRSIEDDHWRPPRCREEGSTRFSLPAFRLKAEATYVVEVSSRSEGLKAVGMKRPRAQRDRTREGPHSRLRRYGGQPSRGWQLSERNGASGEARAECSEPKRGAGGKSARSADPLAPELEAPPGFEPGMEVLQTSALPLGDGADRMRVLRDDEHRIVPDALGPIKDPSRDHGRPSRAPPDPWYDRGSTERE